MTPQEASDAIWAVIFRAAERDPAVKALLFAQPDGGEQSNPGSTGAALPPFGRVTGRILGGAAVSSPASRSPGMTAVDPWSPIPS